MLTEFELKWLKDRKIPRAACRWKDNIMHTCLMSRYGGKWFEAECDPNEYCVYLPDYKDAAEFEALVAANCAAWMVFSSNVNKIERDTQFKPECLKIARLEVEEEME